ncbi:unnamed protein product [Nezara viridula]|uniref:Uncharacterized protein n=1 Tax=Nezara viridula TaxID=85310 RepID=A0A9P0HEK8_NEZVI|nr:unnamed protein product [Nezara viridula]
MLGMLVVYFLQIQKTTHFGGTQIMCNFIPYCTSDAWSGRRQTPLLVKDGTQFTFMGAIIVEQVIRELLQLGLGNASSLILAGSSAGGAGVMLNLESVQLQLQSYPNILVRGISDSGWFLDRTPYPSHEDPMASVETIKKGMIMWQGQIPHSCKKHYISESWRCFFGYRLYPMLKAPLFVFQWLFDEAQMTADNVGAPVTKQQWDYIHKMGDRKKGKLHKGDTLRSSRQVEKGCNRKLVERCSWPQCNLSCPKLHNPFTGLCSFNQPDFPPVYLTLSPLYREATHSTKLIDREVQIQWVNNSVDSISLYNADPKHKSEPEFKTLMYPDGFVSTNIPFGDPQFPGGWEKEFRDLPVPGDHCLPLWVLAYKDKNLVFRRTLFSAGSHPSPPGPPYPSRLPSSSPGLPHPSIPHLPSSYAPFLHGSSILRGGVLPRVKLSLENLELTSLFIPGTHNSGSYRRAETTGQRDSSGRYIITQDQNLWQQLVYGVRYLDLRIGYYSQRKNGSETSEDDSSFWINHDLIKIRQLLPLLDDLKQFMKKTKEEIVILDLHRFPLGFTGRPFRHQHLVKLLERELKEYAVPFKKDYIPTLGSIWDQGKRIIISYGDNIVAQEFDWLWPPIRQLWGNKQTTEGLRDYLDKCMTNDSLRDPGRGLWAAMAQLTPGPLDLLFNPKGSLRIMASQINSNLTEWCRDRWWDKANILAMDFFLGTDAITTAILSNVFKGSTAKHYVTN